MKKLSLVMAVIFLFVMSAGSVFAAQKQVDKLETFNAKVVSLDAKTGKIEIMTDKNVKEMLKAKSVLLKGITVGENVTIAKSGHVLKSIQKAEAAAPEAASGTVTK